MKADRRIRGLEQIREDVNHLSGSALYELRIENGYTPVIGEGNSSADIMFIGEAPGESEAKTGRPFVGRSGKVLDELLASIGLARESVYITNIVKDRPPKNRDPKPEEIALYAPFLDKQIEVIQPKVIATLGRFAMEYVMERYGLAREVGPISQLHGRGHKADFGYGDATILPLFHPAVALYNSSKKQTLLEDFKVLKKIVH